MNHRPRILLAASQGNVQDVHHGMAKNMLWGASSIAMALPKSR